MKTSKRGIVVGIFLASCGLARADVDVQEQILGPAITTPDGWGAVGRHGSHVAIITPKGSRTEVIIDGVEGPKFDRIALTPHMHTENNGPGPATDDQHILFSPDGTRVAYVAQDGADYVVMVDGKEIGRSKQPIAGLVFSPGNKHVAYAIQSGTSPGIVVDGHAGPPPAGDPLPIFSSDDAHYLYPVANAATHQMNPLIDGKIAAYAGHDFVFTGDGHVLGIASDKTGDTLLRDGAPVATAPGATLELFVAPHGPGYAYIAHQGGGDAVVVNGKKVDGVDAKKNKVVFSPDGNHAAIMCGDMAIAGGHGWVIVDGKKQQTYEVVSDGYFIPDSSAFIYTAMNNYKFFLVVNGNEWNGHAEIDKRASDASGAHIAFVDGTSLIRDNKAATPPPGDVLGMPLFSPDGAHLAFVHGSGKLINLDGVDFKGVSNTLVAESSRPSYLVFSPDGKHLLAPASSSGSAGKPIKGFMIDGQMIPAADNARRAVFTPDSQHVFWAGNEIDQHNSAHQAVFLDGKQVAKFESSSFDELPGAWDMGPDGKLSVIGLSGDSIKRFVITPSGDTTISTMIAAAAAEAATAPVPAPPARANRPPRSTPAPRGSGATRRNN